MKRGLFYIVVLLFLLIIIVLKRSEHIGSLKALQVFEDQARDLGLKPEDVALFKDLLQVFTNIAKKQNITFFLYGGTLLGHERINGILPWDDDLDLAMDEKGYSIVVAEVEKLTNYSTYLHAGWILKLFAQSPGTYVFNYQDKWHWPFLDIFLFNMSEVACKDVAWGLEFSTLDVLPVKPTTFLGIDVFIPANVTNVLTTMYGENATENCKSNYLNHKHVVYEKATVEIACSELMLLYEWKANEASNRNPD